MNSTIAPGARVVIRDEEWRVKQADVSSDGGQSLRCEGLSQLVLGKDGIFLTDLERDIEVLDPEQTRLVHDPSSNYVASKLYLDTLLRRFVPGDGKIHLAHRAAMDQIPYQFDPAIQALEQPRQRILIADAVGLGKTLSAGILTSELIARGRGKRILVVATKAMLNQFQQEFFNRFAIPLVRLDSTGIDRVRGQIPAGHNPFHVFDRSIISIDTLKQDAQYRHHLETAYWDIILIDEAHNVAQRSKKSQRARLAELLATRSDSLIMLSATPHDGRPESFASLVNLLDPTAIVDKHDYSSEDFRDKGLVIRRFKKDVAHQLTGKFPERDIQTIKISESPQEHALYTAIAGATFQTLNKRGAGGLYRTSLEKIALSSPAALRATIQNRLKKLHKAFENDRPGAGEDIDTLEHLDALAEAIKPKKYTKFQRLVEMLSPKSAHSEGWSARKKDDRMVIFTESVATLRYLHEYLPKALGLKKNQTEILYGQMKDTDVTRIVEEFNSADKPVRLLICSDIASEGINLHHLSHRMIHFDIPWSLMLFQQRNGRIDRYGQTQTPRIRYLQVDSDVAKFRGDARVLEVLIEKDNMASSNIGDPSEFGAGGSIEEDEATTAEFIERSQDDGMDALDAFLAGKSKASETDIDAFTPIQHATTRMSEVLGTMPRIFESDSAYMREALQWLSQQHVVEGLQTQGDVLRFQIPRDLHVRLRAMPREAVPEDGTFALTASQDRMEAALARARDESAGWANVQYLWPLHPAVQWASDRALNAFGRHAAPVLFQPDIAPSGHAWVLAHGGFPNKRGQFIVECWRAILLSPIGEAQKVRTMREFLQKYPLNPLINRGDDRDLSPYTEFLPPAVATMRDELARARDAFEAQSNTQIDARLTQLETLRERHLKTAEQRRLNMPEHLRADRMEKDKKRINRNIDDYLEWLENSRTIEKDPYIQIAAVILGN